MEIKDIATDVENMEEVRGGTVAGVAQLMGARSQSNSAYQTGGIHNGAGAGQTLLQSNVDNSVNKQSAHVDMSKDISKTFTANNSVFDVSSYWGKW